MANREVISFSMSPDVIADLKRAAKDDERPVSHYAERAIRAYLDAQLLTGSSARRATH